MLWLRHSSKTWIHSSRTSTSFSTSGGLNTHLPCSCPIRQVGRCPRVDILHPSAARGPYRTGQRQFLPSSSAQGSAWKEAEVPAPPHRLNPAGSEDGDALPAGPTHDGGAEPVPLWAGGKTGERKPPTSGGSSSPAPREKALACCSQSRRSHGGRTGSEGSQSESASALRKTTVRQPFNKRDWIRGGPNSQCID